MPIPAPRTSLILRVSCPMRGASRGVTEVGQSESWPEGQPEGRCGARGRASQARTREALGFRPALKKGSATVIWLDGDRRAARKRRAQGPYGVCQVPGRTDQGFKTPRWSVERRCRVPLFAGDPANKPRPLPRCAFRRSVSPQCRGERTKSPTRAAAREREVVAV